MEWVRSQLKEVPSLSLFENHLEVIEANKYNNTGLTVDTCKTLIEGICKTILLNKGIDNQEDKFHMLVRQCCQNLLNSQQPYNEFVIQIISAFSTIAKALGELRNKYGFASHGSDVLNTVIDDATSNYIVKVTDNVCGFIIQSYLKTKEFNRDTRLHYNDYRDFNDKFDDENPWDTTLIKLSASEALYNQDYEAYKAAYFEYLDETQQMLKEI